MSRILRNKKLVFGIYVIIVFAVVILCASEKLPIICAYAALVVTIICAAVYAANRITIKQIARQTEPFKSRGKIRNADYLVIGENIDCEFNGSVVRIVTPGCSLRSCHELIRHTFSILKEDGGTVTVVLKRKNLYRKCGYTVFDFPFWHPITFGKQHIWALEWKKRFPILFAPLDSFRFITGVKSTQFSEEKHFYAETERFCRERQIKLVYMIK